MKCEFVYCLYYSEGKCILPDKDMEIDSIGTCASIIIMQLEDEFLNKERKPQLDYMNSGD